MNAIQTRCVHCLREQYGPVVLPISRGEGQCAWCGHPAKVLTEAEYQAGLARKQAGVPRRRLLLAVPLITGAAGWLVFARTRPPVVALPQHLRMSEDSAHPGMVRYTPICPPGMRGYDVQTHQFADSWLESYDAGKQLQNHLECRGTR